MSAADVERCAFGQPAAQRSDPLACSLLPRCQGLWGSQKQTLMPGAASMSAQQASSRPWSQVRLRTSPAGWRPSAAATASPTLGAVYPSRSGTTKDALDEGRCGALVGLPDDQVAVPAARFAAVLDGGGPLTQRATVPERTGLFSAAAARLATAPPRQVLPRVGVEPAAAVRGPIDRLRASSRSRRGEISADRMRRPAPSARPRPYSGPLRAWQSWAAALAAAYPPAPPQRPSSR